MEEKGKMPFEETIHKLRVSCCTQLWFVRCDLVEGGQGFQNIYSENS